ncbi:MAG: hypothetical protein JKY14_02855 [Paraglaciecola sp.]|nr:hypothetical protein [Paraglaciecola sp.]
MGELVIFYDIDLFYIETKTPSTSWIEVSDKNVNHTGTHIIVTIPYDSAQNGVQYRVKGCTRTGAFSFNCGDWSPATTSVNVSSYYRDTSDSNSNGIRDDAENMADYLEPSRGEKYTYAMHYAYYLQKLVDSTYGPSGAMWADFTNMTHALICAGDQRGVLQKVKAVILDNDAAYSRYISAMNSFGNSSYGK